MTATMDLSAVQPGMHTCWIVRDGDDFVASATRFLQDAHAANEKPIVFGRQASAALDALQPVAAFTADPRAAFLGREPLAPEAMFAMFDQQSSLARSEGYRGLRLVADMDWLIPSHPDDAAIAAFELLLDQRARELDASIVCAYRQSSFDAPMREAARCVHGVTVGAPDEAQFTLVAGGGHGCAWQLAGELDIAVSDHFDTALRAAFGTGAGDIDASSLQFVDVVGLKVLAFAARDAGIDVTIAGAPSSAQRCWAVAGFERVAPNLRFRG